MIFHMENLRTDRVDGSISIASGPYVMFLPVRSMTQRLSDGVSLIIGTMETSRGTPIWLFQSPGLLSEFRASGISASERDALRERLIRYIGRKLKFHSLKSTKPTAH
ncbi:hypothetical protein CBL_04262 [Carabus blaptoides fortunei]